MPILVGLHLEWFVTKLETCEAPLATRWMTDWEQQFVKDLREKFDARADMEDMGLTPWNPTSNQWNTLSAIAEKVK
jgi:hypothetical protein